MHPLAAVYLVGEKYRARILYPDAHEPIEFFFQHEDSVEVKSRVLLKIPSVELVEQSRMKMELDHVKLFGARWDPMEELITAPDDEVISATLAGTTLTDPRLSSEDILAVLNDADKQLDEMEKKLDAVYASPLVEDDDKFTF